MNKKLKVLNLYAGIGGNRKKWKNVEVTAVEFNPEIAAVYQKLYPEDEVVVGDAHQYLLENHKKFDFIWASPPCQTHSSFRQNICVKFRGTPAVYPDMKLYQEVLFLQHNAECPWVVENVKPYYKPLIEPTFVQDRHYFWSSHKVEEGYFEKAKLRAAQIPQLQEFHDVDLSGYKLKNKRQILRNCVDYRVGEYIFNQING